ncbi:MAG: dephospho-CoA kinase [Rhodospirillaceae bacterium]|jgi:dephospho-CoA kinase|nr:dephospho-CoA kinase [Rhodospirillaceae bacterium]MBT5158892.1 dephospho-CoA kinase [Alphaproteobacteria bacterium]MBT5919435.1 dephospho-CoA kinase [Alphaproteobacteria bacterium]
MITIGLTGSIGMGKSTASAMFRKLGVPVFDADAEVHKIMAAGGVAVAPVETAFPGVTHAESGVDRQKLGAAVFGNPQKLKILEGIIHPLVGRGREQFNRRARAARLPVVVYDIPLLFETGGEKKVDYVCVVSAPRPIQIARVMARPGMTRDKLNHIMAVQVPDVIKRRKADFVIPTGNGKSFALMRIRNILNSLKVKTNA